MINVGVAMWWAVETVKEKEKLNKASAGFVTEKVREVVMGRVFGVAAASPPYSHLT